jgi:hypothetical protein
LQLAALGHNPEQSKRLIEAARKAEADESKEGAERAFKNVTSTPKAGKGRS